VKMGVNPRGLGAAIVLHAEAVEGGASLFRQAYVGLGLDIRVHNLRAEKSHVRAGRLVTRN